jgi:hypothetical protein
MHRFFTLIGLGGATGSLLLLGVWFMATAQAEATIGKTATAGLLLLLVVPCGLGAWHTGRLWLQLLRGRTTARLAARDFRNLVANCFFFAQSGGWKE